MVVKKDMNSNGHRLLIQKLLVSIHYLTLFRDEIVLVEKTPSLLGASFSPNVVQSELGEILAAVDALSKQEKLIKSTFWYDEASFRLMNHSLDIVGTWVRGIDNVLEICESKSVFHAILGDNRQRVFGVLIDVFTSLRVTNLSIKEESEYPLLVDPLQVVEYKKREVKKAELMAKIDALTPRKPEEVYDDSKDEKVESIPELVEKELAKEKAAKSEKVLGPGELKEVVKENDEVTDNKEADEEVLETVVADEVETVETTDAEEDTPQTEETEQEVSEEAELEEVSDENEEIEEPAELESEDDLVESEEPETVELDDQADEVATSDEKQFSDNEVVEEVLLDEKSEKEEVKEPDFPVISRDEAVKQFRHFLFDHKGLVCVLDAGDDLKREINFHNAFDRFYGAVDNISDCLVILENVLDELRRRKKEVFDEEGNLISEPTEPINLLVYGQNILLEDSRFETLMSEIAPFTGRSDLHIYSYAAYLD
ncbi:hypothetical protein H702_07420 [Streptococcus equinus JB1]|uniref:Uncharacterized protein n=1 Tax=Streptococcus equinus JB1 TaxID=1294274 RepID=A0A091BRC4_STREI|nr:hypothetical protein [Streptococcus equinus]KFN87269.1 hypothetical protein H702_07420 [Streptococcus equinus JB1]SFL15297.1 hypothetical protein SAMN02910290_00642 [Streptococcus equinus JB1]